MKKIITAAILIPAMLLMPLSAYGEEIQSVRIDSFTGEVSTQGSGEISDIVRMSPGCSYERSTGYYIYEAGSNFTQVRCTAFDGMTTTGEVTIDADPNSGVKLYRDGEKVDIDGGLIIRTPGAYVLLEQNDTAIMDFQIVQPLTSMIETFYIDRPFNVYEATRDGWDIDFSAHEVNLKSEGSYDIKYENTYTGDEYEFKVTIDRTAPELIISGLDEENHARGPVTIESTGDAKTVRATFNGETYNLTKPELTEPGIYRITAEDEAGNTSVADFRIFTYLNSSAWMSVALLVAVLIGMTVYLLRERKKMRVR